MLILDVLERLNVIGRLVLKYCSQKSRRSSYSKMFRGNSSLIMHRMLKNLKKHKKEANKKSNKPKLLCVKRCLVS